MFYIRADGNTEIGMGHVMRCLSIAEAVYFISSEKPVFLAADDACLSFIAERGFVCNILGTDYREMESELVLLSKFLKEDDVILVDSYQVTAAYYRQLRRLCRVACLEDMGTPYPVDLLVNYNIYAEDLWQNYNGGTYIDKDGKPVERIAVSGQNILPDKTLLGIAYMPLREDFQKDMDYVIKDKVTDVMITTGGSDPCFAAGAFVDGLLKHELLCGKKDLVYHVVSGPFNQFAAELKSRYAHLENIVIHENVSDMKSVMKQCDVVITAAGSTLYEVSALGVPMICFYFAENQRQGAQAFSRLTEVVNAGCFSEEQETVTKHVLDALIRCIHDNGYRERLYHQEKALVDGRGAVRIAENIVRLSRKKESLLQV